MTDPLDVVDVGRQQTTARHEMGPGRTGCWAEGCRRPAGERLGLCADCFEKLREGEA